MSAFTKGNWIWIENGGAADEYAEFTDTFSYIGGEAVLRLSVDGDYTLYINGSYVAANQYGDFEHYKNYDELNVTPYLSEERTGYTCLSGILVCPLCGTDLRRRARSLR